MKEFIEKQKDMVEEKIKVTSLEIIVTGKKDKPYFEIKYKEVGKEDYSIGYSSYDLNNVFGWKEECFEIVNQLAEEYSGGWIEKLLEAKKNCSEDSDCSECPFGQIEDRCILAELQIRGGNNGWIPCSERLPKVETEVLIVAKRKWKDGTCKYITTTAMYEDGTVLENDSCWRWEDIDGEWDEANECCIIPEGWWENKHYNADGELNHAVDNEVIAWQPLPAPYQPKEQ